MEVLRPSQLYSKYFDLKMPTMVSRDFSSVVFDIAGTAWALSHSLIASWRVCRVSCVSCVSCVSPVNDRSPLTPQGAKKDSELISAEAARLGTPRTT